MCSGESVHAEDLAALLRVLERLARV